MSDCGFDRKQLVDELIEGMLDGDDERLADIMFEMAKTEEHYRVLGKYATKPAFVKRYIERLASEHSSPLASRPPLPCTDDFDYVGGVQDLPRIEKPCADDFDYVDGPTTPVAASAANRPCADDFDYVDSPSPAHPAVARPCADDFDYVDGPPTPAGALPPLASEDYAPTEEGAVELKPKGSSAVAEELQDLGTSHEGVVRTESADMTELRPRGNTILEQMVIEEPAKLPEFEVESPVRRKESESLRKEEQIEVVPSVEEKELRDLKPVELDDLDGRAASASLEEEPPAAFGGGSSSGGLFGPSSGASSGGLFNPPSRGLFPTSSASDPLSRSGAKSSALRRMQQADDADQGSDESEGDFQLASSVGIQAKKQFRPVQTSKGVDKASSVPMPTLHAGLPGTYDRNNATGTWKLQGPSQTTADYAGYE